MEYAPDAATLRVTPVSYGVYLLYFVILTFPVLLRCFFVEAFCVDTRITMRSRGALVHSHSSKPLKTLRSSYYVYVKLPIENTLLIIGT